jgi:LPXTG-motif cell wall-anchored protein
LGLTSLAHPARASGENDFSAHGTATFEVVESTANSGQQDKKTDSAATPSEKNPTNQGKNVQTGRRNNSPATAAKDTDDQKSLNTASHKMLPQTNMLTSFGLSFLGGLLLMFGWILLWLRRRKNEEN